ncbi:MAG: HigA family addiction module antitoxin [Candidatus Binatus sp.]
MAMKNPPHVGGLIRRQVIEPLGLTVTEAAKVLGVGRQALSSLLNGKTALTSQMGLRVEKAFGPRMEHLMRMQLAFDLAQARKADRGLRVERYVAKRAGITRDDSKRNARIDWRSGPGMTGRRDG